MSYCCNSNALGPRKPPPKKIRIRKQCAKKITSEQYDTSYYEIDSHKTSPMKSKFDNDNIEDIPLEEPETLSAVIALEV